MALFIRFFVIVFAYWLAALAAGAVLVFGAVAPGFDAPPAGNESWTILWFLMLSTSVFVGFFAFAPALIVILFAETFAWRSLLLYGLAGGAIGLFSAHLFGMLDWMPGPRPEFRMEGNVELLAAAGIAAGLVYWLVAGRNAGIWQDRPLQT